METNNFEILNRLYEIGREVFEGLEIEDGLFTATELANHEAIWNKCEGRIYEIENGNFRCSFHAYSVFGIISKFERICGVRGGKQIKFLRGSLDDMPKLVMAMYIDRNKNVVCKKKKLKLYNDVLAVAEKKKRYEKEVYFRSGNIWYWMDTRFIYDEYDKKRLIEIATPASVRKELENWKAFGICNQNTPIYNALYQSMQEEGGNVSHECANANFKLPIYF